MRNIDFATLAGLIIEVIEGFAAGNGDNTKTEANVREKIGEMCRKFHVYPDQ